MQHQSITAHNFQPSGGVEIAQFHPRYRRAGQRHVVDDDLAVGVHHAGHQHVLQPGVDIRTVLPMERSARRSTALGSGDLHGHQLVASARRRGCPRAPGDQVEGRAAGVHADQQLLHAVPPTSPICTTCSSGRRASKLKKRRHGRYPLRRYARPPVRRTGPLCCHSS